MNQNTRLLLVVGTLALLFLGVRFFNRGPGLSRFAHSDPPESGADKIDGVSSRLQVIPLPPSSPSRESPPSTAPAQGVAGGSMLATPSRQKINDAQVLPLVRLDSEDNVTVSTENHGWSFNHGEFGSVVNGKGDVVLKGTAMEPIFDFHLSPDSSKLVINHGDGRYVVYGVDGSMFENVPVRDAADSGAITWQWKDAATLIGVAEESSKVAPNSYPETDVRPDRTLLFLYKPGEKRSLTSLALPPAPTGTVIRLKGVTATGALVLSSVTPENYRGGPSQKELGVFDVRSSN